MSQGKVWLVGAGPGDAELLTIKAQRLLQQADVVVYDALVGVGILAFAGSHAKMIDVGKRASHHPVPQEEINQLLLTYAQQGKKVVRLKGGDPFVFGRGGEELVLLKEHGILYEVVPGITSAVAVPAYAGISVTHRDFASSVHIITGHTQSKNKPEICYQSLVACGGTLVFLMGVGSLPHIANGLIQAGMETSTPAAVLQEGTTAKARGAYAPIDHIVEETKKQNIQAPAVIVVGDVCRMSEQFAWANRRALGGMQVVNVRPADRKSGLTQKLRAKGAEVIEFPCIVTNEIENNQALSEALHNIQSYDWIVLTSPFGAEVFFKQLYKNNIDVRALAAIKFAAIGPATAKVIEQRGILVDYIPEVYRAEHLAKGLLECAAGEKVLLARAEKGSHKLCEILEGAVPYTDIATYTTTYESKHIPPILARIESGSYDHVLFTSASTVKGFVQAAKHVDFTAVSAVCIGKETAAEAEKHGMHIHISRQATLDSMVDTLEELKQEDESI